MFEEWRFRAEPVYVYSLQEGINDGFLIPFEVKQISTTLLCAKSSSRYGAPL